MLLFAAAWPAAQHGIHALAQSKACCFLCSCMHMQSLRQVHGRVLVPD
jgi:hypothetical protein